LFCLNLSNQLERVKIGAMEFNQKQLKILEKTCEKYQVVLMYLFGSRAQGRVTPLSDYDFAILFDRQIDKKQRFDYALLVAGELSLLLNSNHIDVAVLNDATPLLKYQAVFSGQLLFEEDLATRVFFENYVMKEYEDNKHFLQESLNGLTQRIKNNTFGQPIKV